MSGGNAERKFEGSSGVSNKVASKTRLDVDIGLLVMGAYAVVVTASAVRYYSMRHC